MTDGREAVREALKHEAVASSSSWPTRARRTRGRTRVADNPYAEACFVLVQRLGVAPS